MLSSHALHVNDPVLRDHVLVRDVGQAPNRRDAPAGVWGSLLDAVGYTGRHRPKGVPFSPMLTHTS